MKKIYVFSFVLIVFLSSCTDENEEQIRLQNQEVLNKPPVENTDEEDILQPSK